MMEMVVTTGAIRRAELQRHRHCQQTNIQLFAGRMSLLSPNQPCQGTEGKGIRPVKFLLQQSHRLSQQSVGDVA